MPEGIFGYIVGGFLILLVIKVISHILGGGGFGDSPWS